MNKISYETLNDLTKEAQISERQRQNVNLHKELSDPIQRLAIAMEPGTYIRPHQHVQTWELLTSLRGRFVVLNFDNDGSVIDRNTLGEDTSVVEISESIWHAVLSLDSGGVIFEVKRGPYTPFREHDFAPWSPAASTPECAGLMRWYQNAQIGQRWAGA